MRTSGTAMVQDGPVAGVGETSLPKAAEETVPILEFASPIAGFPDHRHFGLVELDDMGLLCRLQSLEDPALRFLVLPPAPFFPDYEPELSDEWAEQLEISDPADALVLLIVTTGESTLDATANLLAPIVINLRTRRAAQIVLDDSKLPLRAPLRPVQ